MGKFYFYPTFQKVELHNSTCFQVLFSVEGIKVKPHNQILQEFLPTKLREMGKVISLVFFSGSASPASHCHMQHVNLMSDG